MTENFSDDHPFLYHYTNGQGLYGILKEQCLRATHYKFLNDSSEFQLFKDVLEKILYPSRLRFYTKEYIENPTSKAILDSVCGPQAAAKNGVEEFLKIIYEKLAPEIYIASFCAKHQDCHANDHGLLSQWRGYGENGGYAIVFNTSGLDEMLKTESATFQYDFLHLADVIYSDEESNEKLNKELTEDVCQNIAKFQIEVIKRSIERNLDFPDNELAAKALIPIYQLSCCYKHRGFKEENEIRIVVIQLPLKVDNHLKKEKERLFRNKNGVETPYIELFRSYKKFFQVEEAKSLPIEKIIVGPHKDKELRAANLRVILRNTDIEVAVSDIPYV
jgi:hypothetical protein